MRLLQNNGHPFPAPDEEVEFRLPPGGYVGCPFCSGGLTPEAEYVDRRERGLTRPEVCDPCRLMVMEVLNLLHPNNSLFERNHRDERRVAAIVDGHLWIGTAEDAQFYFGRIE